MNTHFSPRVILFFHRMKRTRRLVACRLIPSALCLLLISGCSRQESGPFRQRVYVWQKIWTPAVSSGILEAAPHVDGFAVLAGLIEPSDHGAQVFTTAVDWAVLESVHKPVSLVVRIYPFKGSFATDGAIYQSVRSTIEDVLKTATKAGVECHEVQIDYDCPEKKLSEYRLWLRDLKKLILPRSLVFTMLPTWLNRPYDFSRLCTEADGFVLQVHSLEILDGDELHNLCDPDKARRWVNSAKAFGLPFEVALPTYSSQAGFDPTGKLLGVVSDGSPKQWPSGTKICNYLSDPSGVAGLVTGWMEGRPSLMKGVIWFRMPVSSDRNNWNWKTLAVVMAGGQVAPKIETHLTADNPADIVISNEGTCDGDLKEIYECPLGPGEVISMDSLPGWKISLTSRCIGISSNGRHISPLPPGTSRIVGWVLFENRHEIK